MLSLAELQRRIKSGDLTAAAAVAQAHEAIGAQDKTIGAFACRTDSARAANAGPLRGIAVGIKDIMDTADFPTEMGCPAIYPGWQPRADAPLRHIRRINVSAYDRIQGGDVESVAVVLVHDQIGLIVGDRRAGNLL